MQKHLEIGIWSSARNTPEDYKTLKDCGMTHAFIDENYCKRGTEEFCDILRICEKVGLRAYVFNYNSTEKFLSDSTDYPKFPAFDGLIFWDEPTSKHFNEIAAAVPEYERRYTGKTFYVNLLPAYALSFDPNNADAVRQSLVNYENYIKSYCEKVLSKVNGKKIISVDYYPLDIIPETNEKFLEETWLFNLEIVAKYARLFGTEIYYYIQSTSFGKWRRSPEKVDFSFQYFISLAYGARGINHFTYTTPTGGDFSEKDVALIDRNYIPTENYYAVKELNARILKLTEILFGYEYKTTFVLSGEYVSEKHEERAVKLLKNTTSNFFNAIVKSCRAERNTVVGEFINGSGKAYLFVNFTDPCRGEKDTVYFELGENKDLSLYYRGEKSSFSGKTLEFTIDTGEGLLIIVND